MRPLYDDFDEFDNFDFADSAVVKRMLQEQFRDQIRYSNRRHQGPNRKRQPERFDEDEDYDEFEDYSDYDDDEFDRYAGLDFDN
jgi:hypothetical protein